ncbi:hypothetical protein E2542_SST18790 [Spatholobus suberectus]|nr:hypothetical protein E2542_SST18790 [Spatholobus suberectus]
MVLSVRSPAISSRRASIVSEHHRLLLLIHPLFWLPDLPGISLSFCFLPNLTSHHIQTVSYWACSKLCAICFVAGVVFGYTLRGRVKRWASKMLKKLS